MTARPYYDENAGDWVAYRDEPKRRYNAETRQYETVPGEVTRVYLHRLSTGTTSQVNAADNVRFDTRTEALEAARDRWPRRVKGCRIGAVKVTA